MAKLRRAWVPEARSRRRRLGVPDEPASMVVECLTSSSHERRDDPGRRRDPGATQVVASRPAALGRAGLPLLLGERRRRRGRSLIRAWCIALTWPRRWLSMAPGPPGMIRRGRRHPSCRSCAPGAACRPRAFDGRSSRGEPSLSWRSTWRISGVGLMGWAHISKRDQAVGLVGVRVADWTQRLGPLDRLQVDKGSGSPRVEVGVGIKTNVRGDLLARERADPFPFHLLWMPQRG
jgi:hypothetical protein